MLQVCFADYYALSLKEHLPKTKESGECLEHHRERSFIIALWLFKYSGKFVFFLTGGAALVDVQGYHHALVLD